MSVLKNKRRESKAEYINIANAIYDETLAFLTRLSARYARLIASGIISLAAEVADHCEKGNSSATCSATSHSLDEKAA